MEALKLLIGMHSSERQRRPAPETLATAGPAGQSLSLGQVDQ